MSIQACSGNSKYVNNASTVLLTGQVGVFRKERGIHMLVVKIIQIYS